MQLSTGPVQQRAKQDGGRSGNMSARILAPVVTRMRSAHQQLAAPSFTAAGSRAGSPAPLKAVKADAQTEQMDTAMLRLISETSTKVDEAVAATVLSNIEAARRMEFSPDSDLRKRVVASIQKLGKGLLERDVEVRRGTRVSNCFWSCLYQSAPRSVLGKLLRRH